MITIKKPRYHMINQRTLRIFFLLSAMIVSPTFAAPAGQDSGWKTASTQKMASKDGAEVQYLDGKSLDRNGSVQVNGQDGQIAQVESEVGASTSTAAKNNAANRVIKGPARE